MLWVISISIVNQNIMLWLILELEHEGNQQSVFVCVYVVWCNCNKIWWFRVIDFIEYDEFLDDFNFLEIYLDFSHLVVVA